jgi:iron(III) transport system substrate-binding protein
METFRKLSALKPDMRLGHALLAELIAAGEVPVGLTVYSGNADSLKKKGAPIDWTPVEPIVGRPQAVSVASKAPHPNAAMLFVDFVLSPDGQKVLNDLDGNPASKTQETLLTKYKFSMVDPIKWLDEAPKWEKLWKELFMPVREAARSDDLLRPNSRGLDDWPPLVDLGLLKSKKRLGCLLLAREHLLADVGEPSTHR